MHIDQLSKQTEGKVIGELTAHPDDHLTSGHAKNLPHNTFHELVLTVGENGINLTDDPDLVANGGREDEGRRAAKVLGLDSYTQGHFPDGSLESRIQETIPIVSKWIMKNKVEILFTIGGLTDHDDHIATRKIGWLAAAYVREKYGHNVDIFELQIQDNGDLVAPATDESIATIFAAGREHNSQFEIDNEQRDDQWRQVPGGLWLHPDTYERLEQYPIFKDAYYLRILQNGLSDKEEVFSL